MMDLTNWPAVLLATDAPALPAPWVMRLGMTVGWALVLALLGAGLGYKLTAGARRLLALALALWTLVPGPWSPDYWLGLAFHAPSLSAMLLCAWGLQRLLFPPAHRSAAASAPAAGFGWVALWVLSGYGLVLDTFAVLPLQIYAWGFSPALLMALLVVGLLPWILRSKPAGRQALPLWVVPVSLLLFAATRLPSGNLWDALLDPWLWLWLQWVLVRGLYRLWRA